MCAHVQTEVEKVDQTADLVAEQHIVTVLEAGATGCSVDGARNHQRPTKKQKHNLHELSAAGLRCFREAAVH